MVREDRGRKRKEGREGKKQDEGELAPSLLEGIDALGLATPMLNHQSIVAVQNCAAGASAQQTKYKVFNLHATIFFIERQYASSAVAAVAQFQTAPRYRTPPRS